METEGKYVQEDIIREDVDCCCMSVMLGNLSFFHVVQYPMRVPNQYLDTYRVHGSESAFQTSTFTVFARIVCRY